MFDILALLTSHLVAFLSGHWITLLSGHLVTILPENDQNKSFIFN